MDNAAPAALIAIDWGTTSARAYRLDRAGAILAEHSAPLGIQSVREQTFSAALDGLLDGWDDDSIPKIACGMIGSRQGWVEAPYLACPIDLGDLGTALTRTPGGELAIVPGVSCRDADDIPDVMRGEETQLAGALAPDAERALAVLPGTHSKWAIVERGCLVSFATFMTGELYAILMKHSILGRMASDGGDSTAAFARGVARGAADGGLTHSIFGARTLALANELAPFEVGEWLSGILIGHELVAARSFAERHKATDVPITVIGEPTIAARYVRALAVLGMRAATGRADAAAHGLFRIARRADLLN